MTTLVCLDTETGVISRWDGRACTHEAGLTHSPEDGARTLALIETFRLNPDVSFRRKPPRTWMDAVREQRLRLKQ